MTIEKLSEVVKVADFNPITERLNDLESGQRNHRHHIQMVLNRLDEIERSIGNFSSDPQEEIL